MVPILFLKIKSAKGLFSLKSVINNIGDDKDVAVEILLGKAQKVDALDNDTNVICFPINALTNSFGSTKLFIKTFLFLYNLLMISELYAPLINKSIFNLSLYLKIVLIWKIPV